MDDTLERVLQLLLQPIRLQDVDDANEEEQSLTFVIARWNAAGTGSSKQKEDTRVEIRSWKSIQSVSQYSRHVFLLVNRLALCLDTLHGRGMGN